MHDTAARQQCEFRRMGQQGVHQCALGMACSGMDHQPRGLVDDQNRLVLMDDIQRDVLALPTDFRFQYRIDLDVGPLRHLIPRPALLAVHGHRPGPDPFLQPRTGILRKQLGRDLIQSAAVHLLRHIGLQFHPFSHHNSCLCARQPVVKYRSIKHPRCVGY